MDNAQLGLPLAAQASALSSGQNPALCAALCIGPECISNEPLDAHKQVGM